MERILFNLLSNAFKFTSELGSVSIEAEIMKGEKSKLLVVSVVDDGRGIPLEKINKVFERFYQLEGRRENIGGTGIGLALCKSLAEIMEGDISVESEAHVRTCFRVSVPCDKIQEVKESNDVITSSIQDWIPAHVPSKPDEQEFDTGIPKSGAKIIIVEDEPEVRSFLQDALSEKYIITMAENGLEGYEKIKEKVPDLVISDVLMPKMNGFELCQKIKNDASLCHVPVILLTALGDKDNEIKGVELGADDYISKPFSLRLLQVKVEKLIENNARLKNYFSQNSMLPDSSIDISIRDKEFLNNIISSIEKNLSNSHFGVEELSKEIGLSTSQFYRRLKQLTGQIPNAYLRNFRLQRAAKMMRENTGTNIAEIMYEVGFESSSYFSTAFKKLLGCTPTEYQRKYFV
jgi:DNA-binding response OmpR family regulator